MEKEIWEKGSKLGEEFKNKMNPKLKDEALMILLEYDYYISFNEVFAKNYPDEKKSINIIKTKFDNLCSRLKNDLTTLEKAKKELFK